MTIEKIDTRYGPIFRSTVCKDNYGNIETSTRYKKASGTIAWRKRSGADVTLQRPALASFKMAEEKAGQEIVLTGSQRTCALQYELYRSDPGRFAHPNEGVHTQALAIDVNTNHLNEKVRACLKLCGWEQSRPDDEPWHFSFKVRA